MERGEKLTLEQFVALTRHLTAAAPPAASGAEP